MAASDSRLEAAQKAINSIGLGFDITQDIGFDNCKKGSRLIFINEEQCRNLEIPGGVSVPNVPNSIKCYGGESTRLHSGVLTSGQMLRHFNEQMRLEGNIATGHFCASFGLSGGSVKHLASIKSLTYDGWFINRYSIQLEKCHGELLDHVKEAMPLIWDPLALSRFIERFGTHVVVGVIMGGRDMLYVRQENTSHLDPDNVWKLLKDAASMKFTDSAENHSLTSEDLCKEKNLFVIHSRRGGSSQKVSHSEWLETIYSEPDVISMFLLPLTSLSGISKSGYLISALNLYLHHKPPIEDLLHFLDFQLPRQWAPVPTEIRLGSNRKHKVDTWIRFSTSDPKLYINTIPVDVGNRPVTGLRLQLEGRSSDRLAIHLQHLTSLPKSLIFSDHANAYLSCDSSRCKWHKKVKRNSISYVCTAPVEPDDSASIVTGAQLHVENKCLFLRLCFSKVVGATLNKVPEWDKSSSLDEFSIMSGGTETEIQQKGIGCLASLIKVGFISKVEERGHPKPGDVTIGSGPSWSSRPKPVCMPELLRYVGTEENKRGPKDSPGHWVVSGARLSVENGKICLLVKYSLLDFDFNGRSSDH
ncbi:hypothetical protein Fmac_004152 [Flemingia macrophylla]|uniref:MACPF domain-containing protein n=1 Tax=Flemingia macrophylla TaxID=520843 RepID=A0ABD1N435_9FABA